jgi:hypothetical protein
MHDALGVKISGYTKFYHRDEMLTAGGLTVRTHGKSVYWGESKVR